MHIYSIPECLTDEELSENEDNHTNTKYPRKLQKQTNSANSTNKILTSHLISVSCNDINSDSNESSRKLNSPFRNVKSQVSTSLINIGEFHHSDSEASEKDNSDLFTHLGPFNKHRTEKSSNRYQVTEDNNLNGDSPYETLLVKHPNEPSSSASLHSSPRLGTTSKCDILASDGGSHYDSILEKPSVSSNEFICTEVASNSKPGDLFDSSMTLIRLHSKKQQSDGVQGVSESASHYETLLIQPPQSSNELTFNEVTSNNQPDTSPESDSSTSIHLRTKKRQSIGEIGTHLHEPQQNHSRGRSGSVQWFQNILQNIDQKCRGFLDLRRPSDIAEEQIRSSNEDLEETIMEHSDEETSKSEFQSTASSAAGRRFSENVIGKHNRRFPALSTGFGHLKGLWRDRGNNEPKKQDLKDVDQLRPDVCPLFNFPRKSVDEDEMILDALRQAMRKCTIVDPSARPPSSSVFEQLSQITIK